MSTSTTRALFLLVSLLHSFLQQTSAQWSNTPIDSSDPAWFVKPATTNTTYVRINSYYGLNNLRQDWALSTANSGGKLDSVVIMDSDQHAGVMLDSQQNVVLGANGQPKRDDLGPFFLISNLASVDTNVSLSSALRYFSKTHRSVPVWNLMWTVDAFPTQLPTLLSLRSTAPDAVQFYASSYGFLLKELVSKSLIRNVSHLFNGPNSIRSWFPQRMIDAVTVDGTQCK